MLAIPSENETGTTEATQFDLPELDGDGLYRALGGTQGMPLTAFYGSNGQVVDVVRGEITRSQLDARLAQYFGLT